MKIGGLRKMRFIIQEIPEVGHFHDPLTTNIDILSRPDQMISKEMPPVLRKRIL